MSKRVSAAVIYRGPSKLDRMPIVAILTGMKGDSRNPKTDGIAQLWILRDDMNPEEAIATGQDISICGGCVHRGTVGDPTDPNTCYVITGWAPSRIWDCDKRGGYPPMDPRDASRRLADQRVEVRLGAYGDPAALPVPVLRDLLHDVTGWTGYSHQWKRCHSSYRRWLMASTDSIAETVEAQAAGWRTFRIRKPDELPIVGEIDCPASDEQGHRLQCIDCMICNGCGPNDTASRASVSIVAHGRGANAIVRREN